MELTDIERQLDVCLGRAAGWLPAGQLADMRSLVAAGEPGIALENFCTQLEEYDITLPSPFVEELKSLAGAMGMHLPSWIAAQQTVAVSTD